MLLPDSTSPRNMRCGCCFFAFLALLTLVTPSHADECETYRLAVETARAAHAAANIALESAVEAHVERHSRSCPRCQIPLNQCSVRPKLAPPVMLEVHYMLPSLL